MHPARVWYDREVPTNGEVPSITHDPADQIAMSKCDGCGGLQTTFGVIWSRGSHQPRCPWVWTHL